MKSRHEEAVRLLEGLAAGFPLTNLTRGKSSREVRDYYDLAARTLKQLAARCDLAQKSITGTCFGFRWDDELCEMCKECEHNEFL